MKGVIINVIIVILPLLLPEVQKQILMFLESKRTDKAGKTM